MNDGMPVGISVVQHSRPRPSAATCTGTVARPNAATALSTCRLGTYWIAITAAIVTTSSGVTSGEVWPQPEKSRPIIA